MMFATLDDLDGAVEIVVFEKALAAAEGVLALDADRARARPRRPQGGGQESASSCRRSSSSSRPTRRSQKAKEQVAKIAAAAAPEPLRGRVDASRLHAAVIDELRDLLEPLPGRGRVRARDAHARPGAAACGSARATRSPRGNAALIAELDKLLGPRRRRAAVAAA